MKYAIVKFLSTKDQDYSEGYIYENPVNAKKYDAVIVPTRYGLSLAVVDKLTDSADTFKYGYSSKIKAIAEVIDSKEVGKEMAAKKKKDLEKQLEKKVKEMDKVERFRMYADIDPSFAKLLKEYEEA